ncbi:MAG TPA: type IV secretion system protein [Steroidobacteraceae bacterium]|jgi:type IV secretion system protein VirB6|nr:type IV secretion system protein [Steroidobacteraceae bacterium]
MGFFSTFSAWLNAQLAAYIGDNTARLASILEPAIVTLATIYVMAWGYLHLTGKIDEPVMTGLKRILVLALILGVGLRLWLYNTLIVDTFYNAPVQLAAAIVGSADPVGTIDTIWNRGGTVADILWTKGASSWHGFGIGFYIAGALVWCLIGLLCVYAMFLFALSSVALAVLLALGPLFIASLFFDATKRFFAAWIAQLINYALIIVLTVMVAALLLQIVQSYATQTAARGTAILTVDVLHMLLIAVLVFLVLRQVMPIAAGLAGGVTLNSFGLTSRSLGWGLRNTGKASVPVLQFLTPRLLGTPAKLVRLPGRVVRRAVGYSRRHIDGDRSAAIPSEFQGG